MPAAVDEPGHDGPVIVHLPDGSLRVQARLRGQFEPIDGRYRWYGRLQPHDELSARANRLPIDVRIVTAEGEADGVLSDPDPWGRLRVAGTGRPPFALPMLIGEEL